MIDREGADTHRERGESITEERGEGRGETVLDKREERGESVR